jgi:hypothetical protein
MKRGISLALVLATITIGLVGTGLSQSSSASADGTITCAGITCQAEGAVFGSGSNNTGGGNSSGGGGSSSGGTTSTSYQPCQEWSSVNTGDTSLKYPATFIAQGVSDYGCVIGYSLGKGYSCPVGANGVPPIGRYDTTETIKVGGKKITTDTGWRCYYPAGADAPIPTVTSLVCYTSGNAWWYLNSQNASNGVGQYRVGTELSSYPGGAKNTGWNASNPTANCGGINLSFAAQTQVVNGTPTYSFYTMNFSTTYVLVQHSVLPAVWKIAPTNSISAPITTHYTNPYTYSCQLNPALQAGINTRVSFDPATCAGGTWGCTLSNLTVDNSTAPVTLVRNGYPVPVKGSSLAVGGSGVRNVNSPKYEWNLVNGATPNNTAADINSPEQYFKVRSNPSNTDFQNPIAKSSNSMELFNTWNAYNAAQQNKTIEFYWATDPGHPFQMNERFQFNGQFLIYSQAGIGSPTTKSWVTGEGTCANYVTSNPATVLRSVNN